MRYHRYIVYNYIGVVKKVEEFYKEFGANID